MNFGGHYSSQCRWPLTIAYTQVTTTPVKNQDISITVNLQCPFLSILCNCRLFLHSNKWNYVVLFGVCCLFFFFTGSVFESHPCCWIQSLFLFLAESSTVWLYQDLYIRSSVDEHVNCFQLLRLHIIYVNRVYRLPFVVVFEPECDFSGVDTRVELLLHTA